MRVPANYVIGSGLVAEDGRIGSVHDLFFDDRSWEVRYLVVDTGTWLSGRHVLLAPSAVRDVDWANARVSVGLTKERVRTSPEVDTRKPVSRKVEEDLAVHYGWTPYWDVSGYGVPIYTGALFHPGGAGGVVPLPEADAISPEPPPDEPAPEEPGAPGLRSAREVTGYQIEAVGGSIGHVEDFIVDDQAWRIAYVVVDTRNWLPGKKVLISPQWTRAITWETKKFRVDLAQEAIKQSPAFDPDAPLDREYEKKLHAHYGN